MEFFVLKFHFSSFATTAAAVAAAGGSWCFRLSRLLLFGICNYRHSKCWRKGQLSPKPTLLLFSPTRKISQKKFLICRSKEMSTIWRCVRHVSDDQRMSLNLNHRPIYLWFESVRKKPNKRQTKSAVDFYFVCYQSSRGPKGEEK